MAGGVAQRLSAAHFCAGGDRQISHEGCGEPPMKRVAVIGGGISGLAAAYALEKERRQGTQIEYVVFESSPRFGGVIQTECVDNCLIEAGPDSFLTEKSWAIDLCRELGLSDELI